MFRRISCVGHPIRFQDELALLAGAFDPLARERFSSLISSHTGLDHVHLTSSGAAGFFVILKTISRLSSRTEVVLPAYTASSLVTGIRQAGLKPVLCDISLDDFNALYDDMIHRCDRSTLCAVPVHMFGIPWSRVLELRQSLPPDIFVVEDACQAFGAKVHGVSVGSAGDAGFFSFSRGKNLPTWTGGCIVTASEKFSFSLKKEADLWLRPVSPAGALGSFLKTLGLFFVFNPHGYALTHPLVSFLKEVSAPSVIPLKRYTPFQASFGVSLLQTARDAFEKRRQNGLFILEALKGSDRFIIPKIEPNLTPVFNRLPVLIRDASLVDKMIAALARRGIEASRFYFKPLHHLFDLGYHPQEFPNAVYFAERLVTLPVHPLLEPRDLDVMIETMREI